MLRTSRGIPVGLIINDWAAGVAFAQARAMGSDTRRRRMRLLPARTKGTISAGSQRSMKRRTPEDTVTQVRTIWFDVRRDTHRSTVRAPTYVVREATAVMPSTTSQVKTSPTRVTSLSVAGP